MNKTFRPIWVLFFIFLALGVVSVVSRTLEAKERIPWRTDFAAAKAEAGREHKPMLAYFTASWCTYCQQMHRTTWADAKVEQALAGYVPVKIDVDQQQALARQFGVSGLPSYFVLDPRGKVQRAGDGALDADEFIAWLNGKTMSVPFTP